MSQKKFKRWDRVILKTTSKYYRENGNPPEGDVAYGVIYNQVSIHCELRNFVDWYSHDDKMLYSNSYEEEDLEYYYIYTEFNENIEKLNKIINKVK